MATSEHSAATGGPTRPARRVLAWIASLIAAALLLALVVRFGRIDLWPDPLVLPAPWLFVAACAMQIPYTLARALRLRFVLDPLVLRASEGKAARFDWRVLQGSGMLSYPIVILLPFRLGELSRPLLLTRAEQPGVSFAESVSAIAVERVVDGLVVVGMLFFGLGFANLAADQDAPQAIAYVRGFGRLMAMTFVLGLAVLLAAAARPALLERIVGRTIPGQLGRRAAAAAGRIAGTIAVLFNWRRGLPFLLWSLVYWSLTICQLWLVLLACGLELGFADAAAIVAIVGLAIQLPGGPAQAGSFQFGMAAALGLLTAPTQQAAASSFAALMYLLQLGGACALALPGAWLLARARRETPHAQAPDGADPA
ncbi:putative dolichol-P-glucose synthetase [Enhygromyxa salina]|uniref:Putative dolichol-P-glucose synthetase n=1 Tax=Enhygromyxa salina TaxID=215803 RepID=A0A0C1Z7H3_9BACT|nr:lysylphosphatidylglycerol synthase transmembrane domain-containing protein [Enhygromyxa salina]KIG13594.1 putative dolichol-P-glucose synthetase [Enhygromyxa salina]